MSIMSALIVYIVIWTVVLFMILPFGNQVPEHIEKGHASSAPANPRIGKKALLTTVMSAVLWCIAYWFLTSDYVGV